MLSRYNKQIFTFEYEQYTAIRKSKMLYEGHSLFYWFNFPLLMIIAAGTGPNLQLITSSVVTIYQSIRQLVKPRTKNSFVPVRSTHLLWFFH